MTATGLMVTVRVCATPPIGFQSQRTCVLLSSTAQFGNWFELVPNARVANPAPFTRRMETANTAVD